MKRLTGFIIAAILLTSCGVETICPSYGFSKKITRHGEKAQARYSKHRRI